MQEKPMKQSVPAKLLAILLAVTIVCLGLGGALPSLAFATPGTPGVPQAATPVYTEDFNTFPDKTAYGAKSYSAAGSTIYVSQTGQTYTGSPKWINGNRCNGIIL